MKPLGQHFDEISSGGWAVFRRKIKSFSTFISRNILFLLHGFWSIPVVLVIRCLRPWRIIRLGSIRSERIGHFVADAGQQWAMQQQQSQPYLDLYWIQEPTCNEFWAKMVKRNFKVYSWVRPLDVWNRILPGGAVHDRPTSTTASRDIYGWLEKNQAKLQFMPEEDKQAKAWLRRQGWQDGEPFVCLLVRDSAYLNRDTLLKGNDWNYHNYRDSDIAAYVLAAEWLAEQGVWVLRMGKIMANPIPSNHPRVIDYAFHPEKSDFLDIWLFAHCSLCITTGSGPDMVSDIYRRPLLPINFLPLKNLWSWSDALHVSKHLVWRRNKQHLTWQEHLDHSYHYTEQYEQAGIEVIDLSPDEILLAVQEAWLTLQGNWVESDGNAVRQARFWQILCSDPQSDSLHGWIHPRSRVGDAWLKQMGREFLVTGDLASATE